MTTEQLDLFAVEELLPELTRDLPRDLIVVQDFTASSIELLDQLDRWDRQERQHREREPWGIHGRSAYAWTPAVCQPAPWLPADVDGGCRVVLWSVDLRCDFHDGHRPRGSACFCVGDYLYRAVCPCGWRGDPCADENGAVEAALAHVWPGFEELPTTARWAYDGPASKRDPAVVKWEGAAVAAGYDLDWLRGGGPIWTERGRSDGRHVLGRTPHGGYDLGQLSADPT